MSADATKGKSADQNEFPVVNLSGDLKSAYEDENLGAIAPEEELILGSLPLETIEEKIKEIRGRMGGSVRLRQLEDGSYAISPNPKRARTGEPGEQLSKNDNVPADLLVEEEKFAEGSRKGKTRVFSDEEKDEEGQQNKLELTPEETARAAFVQRIRDALIEILPPEEGYRPADMGDVDFDTRFHGLLGPEELPVKFKNQRYLAVASFMHPAAHDTPYIVRKGDILFFKRHERGLPVLEFILGTRRKGYWAALCFVPRHCRSTVWQDTLVHKLPLDQLFRIVALSNVDWQLTMQEQTALDPNQVEKYVDLWEKISRKFGDHIPKQVVRVLTQGLTLSDKLVLKQEASKHNEHPMEASRPSFEVEEASFEGVETGSKDELIPLQEQQDSKRPKPSSKPIVDYRQLYSAVIKNEKPISGLVKDQVVIKSTLKEHSKVLDAISSSIMRFNDPKMSSASLGNAAKAKIQDLEAEVRGLKTSVNSLVTVCKDLQAYNTKLTEKMDLVLQDKSRLTWEEFSQRQKDILHLNAHLAVPMQAPRWTGLPLSGPPMGSYREGLHPGGQISAGGMQMSYGGGSALPGSVPYAMQSVNPSVGGPTQGLPGVVAPTRGEEKQEPQQTAPTQEPSSSASFMQGGSNDELMRLLLQQLKRSDAAQK